ncbi:SRPBCC domain-containing protein [Spiractinospora alimapuensis]|uniref:SRPBCC family protein n=1 Tax=Spiractinospora alimapuensis TaxID=2820884 RepID=UPI001F251168|nr:SRPBCC domain-containing protein [Spiractinospora alimapuensis]QVQ54623.1 SRPBCC domain-containing protein [Spiractinospora alimapuensis]
MNTPVGLTHGAGFEIGVSRTFTLPADVVWRFVTSSEGLALWLGDVREIEPRRGAPYRTAQGVTGELRGYEEGRRVRLTHHPEDGRETTVQLTVTERNGRAVLGFHQERLGSAEERAHQRDHWRSVMADIVAALEPRASA